MKASVRSRLPSGILFAQQHRSHLRRLKSWWCRTRCTCPQCIPWYVHHQRGIVGLSERRNLLLRFHALTWLRMLDPLDPRLRGPLAEEDLLGPKRLVDGIELDVDCDAPTLLDLLARFGHRAEPLTEGPTWRFLVESFEPIEITLRRGKSRSDEHTCDAAELAVRLRQLPSSLRLQMD